MLQIAERHLKKHIGTTSLIGFTDPYFISGHSIEVSDIEKSHAELKPALNDPNGCPSACPL